ncbi:MAG: class I SAM-dependent methyltransferase [Proteobacteria bacterium]|nr:class I SAM-dependent methyltransferase [Pseudomonadota bacterium]
MLAKAPESYRCEACAGNYPIVAEMPDFRIDQPAWIDFGRDRDRAFAIDEIVRRDGLEAAIFDVFKTSRRFAEQKCHFRTRQVQAGADKYTLQLDGWLADIQADPVIEVGIGPGQLAVALARRGYVPHGIDVSMEWLAVAKHWVREQGVEPVFAGAMAEGLPLPDASVRSYVSLDVIEHVGDQGHYLAEMTRILKPGGHFALVTPNRYSLSPEPHVGVWGVGYLPRPLQAKWVRMRAGVSYDFNRLLSVWELQKLFRESGGLVPQIDFPEIAEAEISLFGPGKAKLARLYNQLSRTALFRLIAPLGGAYYRVTGRKPVELAAAE